MVEAMPAGLRLDFYTDPGEFLAVAARYLATDPVVSTVVTTVSHRLLAQQADGGALPHHCWWLVVKDGSGAIVGVGMRTAQCPPYPPYLLPMPDDAARALALALHERGEEVLAANGALPAVEIFISELNRLGGGQTRVDQRLRLHELGALIFPERVPGRLEAAGVNDVELVMKWFDAFAGDADEQAGRPRGTSMHEIPGRGELLGRLRTGRLWFWVDDAGERVHLTGASAPAFGVARVGPVYTPPAQRGRGWASNAVAEVSRRLQGEGARVCLFTDLANPVSNRVYLALGYRPVVDVANLVRESQ